MVPEAIVAMLATIRLGAVHSVVFGGFAAKELSTRIKHAEPKVLILIIYKKKHFELIKHTMLNLLQVPIYMEFSDDIDVVFYFNDRRSFN